MKLLSLAFTAIIPSPESTGEDNVAMKSKCLNPMEAFVKEEMYSP